MTAEEKRAAEAKSEIIEALPKACTEEAAAVEFLERQRWGDNPSCPHCGNADVVKMKDDHTHSRNRRFLWYCRTCKKQYTVRVGTVFEDSRIALRHWCFAFWAACASKKGVSAKQIQRQCQISYKSALFLMHRIRFAMTGPDQSQKLVGTVEADETYVGGKPRKGHASKARRGRGTAKTPVMVLVERNGDARASVIADVSAKALRGAIEQNVDKQARINTDDFRSYRALTYTWPRAHDVVNHSIGEYSRGDAYTNTAENFFALLKRGIHGTFHSVSKRHLHRYVNEFAFRWCARKVNDGQRVRLVIQGAEGKRLMYREPTVA